MIFLAEIGKTRFASEEVLARLKGQGYCPPRVIVLYLYSYVRISPGLFKKLLGCLAPGGVLAICRMEGSSFPAVLGFLRGPVSVFLLRVRPQISAISRSLGDRCVDFIARNSALNEANSVSDCVRMAVTRVGTHDLLDYNLEYKAAGTSAVFIKK